MAGGVCTVSLPSAADPEQRFFPPPSKLEITLPAREASSVEVLKTAPRRSVVQIGSLGIRADGGQSREDLLDLARRFAAQRGADFIAISERSGPTTLHFSAPNGGHGGSSVQRRRSMNAVSSADVLYVGLGVIPKAALGIEFANRMQTGGRMIVQGFKSGSNAAQAGLAQGDEITLVDGLPMDVEDARYEKWRITAQPGQTARLTVRRESTERTVDVRLIANEE